MIFFCSQINSFFHSCFSTEPGIGPPGPEGKKGPAGKSSEMNKSLFSLACESTN